MIHNHVRDVLNGSVNIVDYTQAAVEKATALSEKHHFLSTISDELALEQAKLLQSLVEAKDPSLKQKPLAGVLISVKDGICVEGVQSAASSNILTNYQPLFSATVVQRAVDAGAIVIGKTVQDEFGFGTFCVNHGSEFARPTNPLDATRCCGGSSGGAAGLARAADFAHIAIGESTGGSITAPAAFCGVAGLCPTYGRNSRYGLLDYANSLDKIGALGKTVFDAALLQSSLGGYDSHDSTSLDVGPEDLTAEISESVSMKKVAVIKEGLREDTSSAVAKGFEKSVDALRAQGVVVDEISFADPIKHGIAAYYILATAEASTNLQKYCGLRYGRAADLKGAFNEYFSSVRSEYFGAEAKRRIILGTFARMSGYRDAYYLKALKVRAKLVGQYKALFKEYDALITPTVPVVAPRFDEIDQMSPLQHYQMDVLTVSPNLCGLPHLSVPVQCGDMPVGVQLVGDHLKEAGIVRLGAAIEEKL